MSISGSMDRPGANSKHLTSEQILAIHPSVAGFRFFAFVRNPWDRLLSMHRYLLKTGIRPDLPIPADFPTLLAMLEFGEPWLQSLHSIKAQSEFVGEEVAFIGRYESLERDFLQLCIELGVNLPLSHQNASVDRPMNHRPFYSDRTAEIVSKIYQQDIIRFGYTF